MNKHKIKGTKYERKIVEILNSLIKNSKFKRVVGSGMIGTLMDEASLTGDIVGEVENFPQKLRGEAKCGYSNRTGGEAKSFSLKKVFLDKISEEAEKTYSFPFLVGHFDNARSGVQDFIVLDINDFAYLINMITDLNLELETIYEEK